MPVSAQDTTKTYRIAINKTSYPYHFVNKQNNPDGMMVELWQLWAKKQGVKVEFVPLNWQQTLKQVQDGRVDIHAGLSQNSFRAEMFDFSSAFFRQSRHLFLHRSIAHIRDITQLTPYAVGVVAGSSHEKSIKAKYPNLTLRIFSDRHTLYNAALKNEILIIAGVDKLSKNFSDYDLLNKKYPAFARISYQVSDYGAAVTKSKKPLLNFIQQGLDRISAEEKSALEIKWLGVDKSDNVLILSYFNNQMPFSDTSAAGNAQGFFIELWQMWAKYSGLEVEFVVADPNQLNQLSQDSADIHIASLSNEKDKVNRALGPVIYSIDYSLFLSDKIDKASHISEIRNKNIGVVSTPDFVKDINKHVFNANIIYFDDYPSLFAAIVLGELDIIAGQSDVIEHYLLQNQLQSTYFHFPGYRFKRDVHAALNKTNFELEQLIVEGFDEIPLANLIALEKKWNLDTSSGFFKSQLSQLELTEQEASWVKAHPVVKFGITKNWLPIEFVDKYGEFKGTNPDLFQLITQRLNLKIDYVAYNKFEDLYQALLEGEVDVIGSVMATETRKQQVLFTESYWSMPWVIVHPRELGKQLNLENFEGEALAITKGYYLVSVIRKKFPLITLRLVDNSEEGLLAVQKGMVDGFIDSLSSGTELLKKESLVSLGMSVLDEVDRSGNHLAINQSLPVLATILNKSVLTLSDVESQRIYEKWFDISIETGLDKNVVLRVAAQIGVLIVIIIIIIMVWNRRLYLEIKSRRKLEKQMKYMATHDDLTGLANRVLLKDRLNTAITFHRRQKLLISVLFIDLDGFKNINDNYGHDVGDELLIEVASRLKGCVRESDTVVRFGGDEFVLLLTGLHNQDEAAYVADKVLKLIQQPIKLSSKVTANIGCSIGIAMYPDDGESDNDLLKVADSLMYEVKAAGKNHYIFNRKTSAIS
ncbi:transporter substrate-binding domain-containing protein [Colwellia sp. M166]|uniref:transporter substrate-binding domain-containing protein n=1 Tax=Colwellia sp. M166 TaxID=2583805 RepID=UPI00211E8059|nr:transporter substrate-binding domain-containing protein [Colwellia sp. M166]UUO24831.1 transporter substrate-binding domain-containing protein [Colwellia sp. M166]|tara:strand:- start:710 stop:3490 length:2781 start_codon:yes stop_codon:yes gene_type:complete